MTAYEIERAKTALLLMYDELLSRERQVEEI